MAHVEARKDIHVRGVDMETVVHHTDGADQVKIIVLADVRVR
jgi:hypothetical protein